MASDVDPAGSVAAPRLDEVTLTVSVYPTCGEATVVRHVGEDPGAVASLLRSSPVTVAARTSVRGAAADPEESARASIARTRRTVRRWCVHHRASRLATLTFRDEPADLDAGWELVAGFRRRLAAAGIAQPLIVPEWGSQGGRLHFHAAMPTYVPKDKLAALWGHGFVDVRRLGRRGPGGAPRGAREQARIAAHYVAGYVAKLQASAASGAPSAHAGPGFNRRRYSIPKGTTVPEPVRFVCSTDLFDAWAEVQRLCGHRVQSVWSSSSVTEWRGPPTLLLMG